MILYKNVDICDLKSIMEKGILSLDACGNNNWDDGKRGENSTSVVYLFQPLTKGHFGTLCHLIPHIHIPYIFIHGLPPHFIAFNILL